jgi:chromosomal replication initiation ATPase DnaA
MANQKDIQRDLIPICCHFFGIEAELFLSKRKPKEVVRARRFVMACLKDDGKNLDDSKVGDIINRHRTTVIHNLKKHESFKELYPDYRDDYTEFRNFINENFVF